MECTAPLTRDCFCNYNDVPFTTSVLSFFEIAGLASKTLRADCL
jgi:hypothetical protein